MQVAKWTNFIMHIALVVLCVWEVYTLINHEKGDTISEVIRTWNYNTGGLVAWVMLALWVHWFLPLPPWWTGQ